ncbi:unnamed protein product [Closterium sp. NIES-64]|nr:unnamed protein product [Closterium sp. NIES-64]
MLSIMATMSAPVLQGPMAGLSCLALLTRLRHLYGPLPLPSHLFLPAFSYLLSHPCPPSPAFSLIPARLLLPSLSSLPAFPSPLTHASLDVTGNFNVHRSAPFPTEWMALTGLDTLAHFLAQHPPVRPPLLPLAPPLLSHLPSSRPSPPLAPPLLSHLPSSRGTCRRAGLNGFTGSIPSTISALTALTDLELDLNNI